MPTCINKIKRNCRLCLMTTERHKRYELFVKSEVENNDPLDNDAGGSDESQQDAFSNMILYEKVEYCCGIRLAPKSQLPSKICGKCFYMIHMWFNFRQMSCNSQVFFSSQTNIKLEDDSMARNSPQLQQMRSQLLRTKEKKEEPEIITPDLVKDSDIKDDYCIEKIEVSETDVLLPKEDRFDVGPCGNVDIKKNMAPKSNDEELENCDSQIYTDEESVSSVEEEVSKCNKSQEESYSSNKEEEDCLAEICVEESILKDAHNEEDISNIKNSKERPLFDSNASLDEDKGDINEKICAGDEIRHTSNNENERNYFSEAENVSNMDSENYVKEHSLRDDEEIDEIRHTSYNENERNYFSATENVSNMDSENYVKEHSLRDDEEIDEIRHTSYNENERNYFSATENVSNMDSENYVKGHSLRDDEEIDETGHLLRMKDYDNIDDNESEFNPEENNSSKSSNNDDYNLDIQRDLNSLLAGSDREDVEQTNKQRKTESKTVGRQKNKNNKTLRRRKSNKTGLHDKETIQYEQMFPPNTEYKKLEDPDKYICNICGNIHKDYVLFKQHMRTHSKEKPYTCEVCKKAFRTPAFLKCHMAVHTGEKRFKCKYCSIHYTDASSRHRHEKTHTHNPDYTCNICGKSFMYKTVLRRHVQLHSGERMYSCGVCNTSFALPHHLKQHIGTIAHREKQKSYEALGFKIVFETKETSST